MKNKWLMMPAMGLALMLTPSCSQNEIPDVLKTHKDKALFVKLNNKSNQMVKLFNGKDYTGFYTFTAKYGRNNDVEKAFTIADGAMHLCGESMGYVCTEKSYRNYYLKAMFRWGEKRYPPREDHIRDSGILYHFADNEPDSVWPKSVECQIQEGDCGDFWLVGGVTAQSPNTWDNTRIVKTNNFEKPRGEWNTVEVICYDDKAEHYINGHKVNEASALSVTEGRILLQLEAAEVFYKDICILDLK